MFGLFKKRKQRLFRRMSGLASVGRIIICSYLMKYLKDPHDSDDSAASKAAAITNWIFDGNVLERHAAVYTKDKAKYIAEYWLKYNTDLQELAVQTSRVEAISMYGADGFVAEDIAPVLLLFGKNYPEAPFPDEYEKLVSREFKKLPLEMQESLRNRGYRG